MGFFNMFNKSKDENGIAFDPNSRTVSEGPVKNGPISTYSPKGYGDVELIIDDLKAGGNVILDVTMLKFATKIRVLDLISGALYALGGGMVQTQPNVYFLSPTGIAKK